MNSKMNLFLPKPLSNKKLSVILQAILGYIAFGLIQKMISETQILYRREGAKGNRFYLLRGIQLLIFA